MKVSALLNKTFASQKLRVSQSGQAVVEYLLILVMTVSIILGVMYQFNDAFKNFLDSYFGDYIACLLETGELPALGGDGPTQSECNKGFSDFSIASGRPAKTSSGGSSGNSGTGDTPPPPIASSSGGGNSGSRPARFNSGSSPSNADASSGGANRDRPAKQSVPNNQELKEAGGLQASASDSTQSGGGRRIVRKKIIYLGDNYLTEDAKQKKERQIGQGKRSKKDREMLNLRKAQFELKVPEAKRTVAQDYSKGFSFAFFIKFMLIAGIIIAILIFLGGQAMQIKKSWQKSE